MHICPYRAMAIFILNKISLLEPKAPNRVRSAFELCSEFFEVPYKVSVELTHCLSIYSRRFSSLVGVDGVVSYS